MNPLYQPITIPAIAKSSNKQNKTKTKKKSVIPSHQIPQTTPQPHKDRRLEITYITNSVEESEKNLSSEAIGQFIAIPPPTLQQQVTRTNPLVFDIQNYEKLFASFQESKALSRIAINYLLNAKFNIVVNGNKSNFVFELHSQDTTKKLLYILKRRYKLHYDAPLKNIRQDNKCITINDLRVLLYFFSKFPKNIRQTFPMGNLLSYRRDIEPKIGKKVAKKEEFIPVIDFEQTKNFFRWLNSKPDFDIKVEGLNTRVHPLPQPRPRTESQGQLSSRKRKPVRSEKDNKRPMKRRKRRL